MSSPLPNGKQASRKQRPQPTFLPVLHVYSRGVIENKIRGSQHFQHPLSHALENKSTLFLLRQLCHFSTKIGKQEITGNDTILDVQQEISREIPHQKRCTISDSIPLRSEPLVQIIPSSPIACFHMATLSSRTTLIISIVSAFPLKH